MTPEDALDVLTAIAAYDLRTVGESDVIAWHAAIGELPKALALEAVVLHHKTNTERIKPAHVVGIAKQIRKDRAEREDAAAREARQNHNDRRHGLTAPDPQLAGMPIGGADGRPIWSAYEINDAISVACPTCRQPAECACVNPINDSARKIPCVERLRAGARR